MLFGVVEDEKGRIASREMTAAGSGSELGNVSSSMSRIRRCDTAG